MNDEINEQSKEEIDSAAVEINSFIDYSVVDSFFGGYDYYTKEQLMEYVSRPMLYHKQLMDVSEKMYNRNGVFGQTVSKMVSAPSLDAVIIPYSVKKRTKKILDSGYDVLNNKINHKLSTQDGLFNSFLYGEYIAILRDTKKVNVPRPKEYTDGERIEGSGYVNNVMLQPLDLRFCRFEGFANGDYVVSFDMQYFDMFRGDNLVGEIRNYPDMFIKGYNAYRKDNSKRWLLLPQESTFAYKYHGAINESHGRPLSLFALIDILFADDYKDSQRNNMYKNSSTIRWMRLPEGERKGSCSLNKDQQNNQYNAFKGAVSSNDAKARNRLGGTTTLKLAPGTEIGKLDNDSVFLKDTLTDENNNNISTSLGFPIAALNGGSEGTNYSTLTISISLMLAEVYSMLEQFSFQYTKLLNNYLGLKDDNRLIFRYLKTSTLDATEQFNRYKELYTLAGGSRTILYSSAYGDADLYMRLMEFEKSQNFDEKYLPHSTSYTMTGDESSVNTGASKGGAPEKEAQDLSPKGEATRRNGGNNMPRASKS